MVEKRSVSQSQNCQKSLNLYLLNLFFYKKTIFLHNFGFFTQIESGIKMTEFLNSIKRCVSHH